MNQKNSQNFVKHIRKGKQRQMRIILTFCIYSAHCRRMPPNNIFQRITTTFLYILTAICYVFVSLSRLSTYLPSLGLPLPLPSLLLFLPLLYLFPLSFHIDIFIFSFQLLSCWMMKCLFLAYLLQKRLRTFCDQSKQQAFP